MWAGDFNLTVRLDTEELHPLPYLRGVGAPDLVSAWRLCMPLLALCGALTPLLTVCGFSRLC